MRKRGLAVLAFAAVMTFGSAGIQAMAAEGWAQEGGNWVYYNACATAGAKAVTDIGDI